MAAAVLFQPALMGRPRTKGGVWVVRREIPAGVALQAGRRTQTATRQAEHALAEMQPSMDERKKSPVG
jgi:hypothetical protein